MAKEQVELDALHAERRRAARVRYEATVMVAEYDGQRMPPLAAFTQVVGRDLSPTGMSFLAPEQLESKDIVILLGAPDKDPIFVTARIAHATEGFWDRKRQFLIGCDFTGRLQWP